MVPSSLQELTVVPSKRSVSRFALAGGASTPMCDRCMSIPPAPDVKIFNHNPIIWPFSMIFEVLCFSPCQMLCPKHLGFNPADVRNRWADPSSQPDLQISSPSSRKPPCTTLHIAVRPIGRPRSVTVCSAAMEDKLVGSGATLSIDVSYPCPRLGSAHMARPLGWHTITQSGGPVVPNRCQQRL